MTAIALTIAGSDSAGGAGHPGGFADLRRARGAWRDRDYGSDGAEHPGVEGVHMVPPEFVLAQMRTIAKDLNVGAVKTGMLGTLGIVEAVVEGLKAFPGVPVVVDPVMVAQSGDPLLDDNAIDAVRTKLMPLAVVVTPNMPEAARLLGGAIARDEAEMTAQATRLRALGANAVLLKGGHATGPDIHRYFRRWRRDDTV